MDRDYAEKLKNFADKLASDSFQTEEEIKAEMTALNLSYTSDEIERLNRVLLALHPFTEEIKLNDNTQQEINH